MLELATVPNRIPKLHIPTMSHQGNADEDTRPVVSKKRNTDGSGSSRSRTEMLVPPSSTCSSSSTEAKTSVAAVAADETSTISSSESFADVQRIIKERGKRYPRAQYNFEVDPSSPRSHWRRVSALNDNVIPYLLAHGLPQSRAEMEANREYVQRWRLIRTVRDEAGGGAVFEIDTDWGRRVQVYDIDEGGWDEECADDTVLFGRHVREKSQANSGGAADIMPAAAAKSSPSSPAARYNIHRRSHWEGRSFIASTISPTGGLVERTERYLTSAAKLLSPSEREQHLPRGVDDTIMVIERTHSPEVAGMAPEVISCREIFVRCYHYCDEAGDIKPGAVVGGAAGAASPCTALPVLYCPFEDIETQQVNTNEATAASTSTIATMTKREKDQTRVRTVLIPLRNNVDDNTAASATNSAGRYRVCIEGDAPDMQSRGLLGLLSDAIAAVTSAQGVLGIDASSIASKLGLASALPNERKVLEDAANTIKMQVSALLEASSCS
mmetsp:Transcript_14824/g.32248  ORF Transcript_14824/g.32248 Transcript_14824/m.32248 type:complete len:497 (-) Transcript_14824:401-1891(-)